MSRSGYSEGCADNWAMIRWRGSVASAIRGRQGQAFLQEMLSAMDAMADKRLIAHELQCEGALCAIGAVGAARGVDMSDLDPEDYHTIAGVFGINEKLVQEIVWMNDEALPCDWDAELLRHKEMTPQRRFEKMRDWIVSKLAQKPRP